MARTLGDTGQLYITQAAARAFGEYVGLPTESARRRLTVLLLDATRPRSAREAGEERWRARSRRSDLDVQCMVVREEGLVVVTHAWVRAYSKR